MLRRAARGLLGQPGVARVAIVIRAEQRALYDEAVGDLDLLPPVLADGERQDSVRAGLEALALTAPLNVLIHDAARPSVPAAMVARLIRGLANAKAVAPVLPVVDSLRRVEGGIVDRTGLMRVQTPQGFDFATILSAHRRHVGERFTDDASLVEADGHHVLLVEGAEEAMKITGPEDLARAELLVGSRRWRSALGYDVHRLVAGRPLWLGGILIPSPLGLDGHSDADVVLHALTDAILGLIGAGDIGVHFPPSDMRWKDARSDQFVRHAISLLHAAGGKLDHADVTILAERPKIGPYRDAMRARLAEITGLPAEATSVKATTTEGLGFTGRGEGIVAQVVVTGWFGGVA